MTIEEKFKELGFEKIDEERDFVLYIKKVGKFNDQIAFEFLINEGWKFKASYYVFSEKGVPFVDDYELSLEEIKVIEKKLEELESDSRAAI